MRGWRLCPIIYGRMVLYGLHLIIGRSRISYELDSKVIFKASNERPKLTVHLNKINFCTGYLVEGVCMMSGYESTQNTYR